MAEAAQAYLDRLRGMDPPSRMLDHIAEVEAELRADGVIDPARRSIYCGPCGVSVPVVDEFDDETGYEECAHPVHVVVLDCDHDIVTDLPRWPA